MITKNRTSRTSRHLLRKFFTILGVPAFCLLLSPLFLEALLWAGFPFWFPSLEPYILREMKDIDDWTHAAFTLEEIEDADAEDYDAYFVYTGGSAAKVAISGDEAINEELQKQSDKKLKFISVCSIQQNFFDAVKLFRSGKIQNKTLIIAISPVRFTHGAAHGDDPVTFLPKDFRTLTAGDKAARIFEKHGFTMPDEQRWRLFRSLDHFSIIYKAQKAYRKKHGRLRKVEYQRRLRDDWPAPDEERIEKMKKSTLKKVKTFKRMHDFSADLFHLSLEYALKYDNEVILLDLPTNPIVRAYVKKFSPKYDNIVRNAVKKYGLSYIDLRMPEEWRNNDFNDALHLRNEGQSRYKKAMVSKLLQWLEKH